MNGGAYVVANTDDEEKIDKIMKYWMHTETKICGWTSIMVWKGCIMKW